MVTVRNFEVISDKYDMVGMCSSGSYAQNGTLISMIIVLHYLLTSPFVMNHVM